MCSLGCNRLLSLRRISAQLPISSNLHAPQLPALQHLRLRGPSGPSAAEAANNSYPSLPPHLLQHHQIQQQQVLVRQQQLQQKPQRRLLPALYGPSSVSTGLDEDFAAVHCLEGFVGDRLSAAAAWPLNSLGCMYTPIRTKKKRGKKEVIKKNAEQIETKASSPPLRLEDHTAVAEPPYAIAATIRLETQRALKGRKTSRMFAFRNKYRLKRLLGLTHDAACSSPTDSSSSSSSRRKQQGRCFITPLTRLQHQASLPRSPLHSRFNFRHSLRYTVEWGGPQVSPELPSACCVSLRLSDLNLSAAQRKQFAAVVGGDRLVGDFCCIEMDSFKELNKNAAHLGDSLELLIREIRKL